MFEIKNTSGNASAPVYDSTATPTTLVSFNGSNGANPLGGLTLDGAGNLYGTTQTGGTSNDGTVFEIKNTSGNASAPVYDPNATSTTLVSFEYYHGANPLYENLTLDSAGNLYGTTEAGGSDRYGTVFELSPPPAAAPTISALVGGQSVASGSALALFSTVAVADSNANSPTDTLTITQTGGGSLQGLTGSTVGSTTTYTLTGTADAITTQLDALLFTPPSGSPGSSTTTQFSLSDTSSALPGTPATAGPVTITDTVQAIPPIIANTSPAATATSASTATPFTQAVVTDANAAGGGNNATGSATDTLTITLQGGTGTLADASGFVGGTLQPGSAANSYTLTGTGAAITTELQQLVFTPSTGAANSVTTTTFQLSDTSAVGGASNTDTNSQVTNPSVVGVPVSNLAALDQDSRVTTVGISDTGENLSGDELTALGADGKVTSIAVSDGQPITLTYAQYATDGSAFARITTPYSLAVSGVAVAGLVGLEADSHVTSVGVADTAANVVTAIAALNADTKISAIVLTGSNVLMVPSTSIMMSLIASDQNALAAIQGGYSFAVASAGPNPAKVLNYNASGVLTSTVTSIYTGGVLTNMATVFPDGSSDTKTYSTDGVITGETIKYAAGAADISDTKVYTAGVLTSDTVVHADKSKDVYRSGITNQVYVAEHDVYNTAGTLTGVTRTHADGTLAYTYSLATDGTKTTDQYSNSAVLTSDAVVHTDGSSDTKTYTAGVLTLDTVVHADKSKDVYRSAIDNQIYVAEHDVYNTAGTLTAITRTRADGTLAYTYSLATNGTNTTDQDTKVYTGSVLTSETVVHADKSKDVYRSAINNQTYVAEHDVYNTTGTLTGVTRTHTDGTLAYTYSLATDGTKTTDQYSSTGVLTSDAVVQTDGSSDTKVYTAGVLTSDTVVHADKSKDVYRSGITNQVYVAEHDVYNTAGTLTGVTRTHADGTLAYTYSLATDGTKTTDQYSNSAVLTSDAVVHTDGSSDTKTYTAGVLTLDTVVHADKSKDVYRSAIDNQIYVAEHDVYNTAGTLTAVSRTHVDNSLAYTYSLGTDGTKTTDQYSATGVLTSDAVVHTDGSSDTKVYTAGVPTSETVVHADKSKDVYQLVIAGQPGATEHDTYSAAGTRVLTDVTNADGSHKEGVYTTGQTLTSTQNVADIFTDFGPGGDTFVFKPAFGHDTVSGFQGSSVTTPNTMQISTALAPDFLHLQALMTASGHDTLITFNTNDSILVKNTAQTQLVASNFSFA